MGDPVSQYPERKLANAQFCLLLRITVGKRAR